MKNKYCFQNMHSGCAKAFGRDLSISTKHAVEICSYLRGKTVDHAVKFLENVIDLRTPVPFKRFTNGPGHKKGNLASGRYPVKASQAILRIIKSALANAEDNNLNTEGMVVKHIVANKASTPMHNGRQRRRFMKRTHIEVVLEEVEQKTPKSKKLKAKPETKAEQKTKQKSQPKEQSKSSVTKEVKSSENKSDNNSNGNKSQPAKKLEVTQNKKAEKTEPESKQKSDISKTDNSSDNKNQDA